MIDTNKIVEIAEAKLVGTDRFVVSCICSASNEIELLLDADSKVLIDDCIALSRAVEEAFDRDAEDFQLTVASAGIGSEIKLLRQYPKLIGRLVEVLLLSGIKIVGELKEATEQGVKVAYEQKQVVETSSGKKKKQIVEVEENYSFDTIKWVKEYIDFK